MLFLENKGFPWWVASVSISPPFIIQLAPCWATAARKCLRWWNAFHLFASQSAFDDLGRIQAVQNPWQWIMMTFFFSFYWHSQEIPTLRLTLLSLTLWIVTSSMQLIHVLILKFELSRVSGPVGPIVLPTTVGPSTHPVTHQPAVTAAIVCLSQLAFHGTPSCRLLP